MTFARGRNVAMNRREPTGGPWSGNFASLFSGVLQSVQTDLGLTYGGTMLASGTTPPVITLTGSLSTIPVPIKVTVTLGGALGVWTGSISYDGGATQAQTFTSAATVNLTGAGAGLVLNIAAGAANVDNVWLATCAGLADQSGNALHYSQGGATQQFTLAVGVNGFASILADAVNDAMTSALNLPQAGTTPTTILMVMRQPAFVTVSGVIANQPANTGNACFVSTNSGTQLRSNNGASVLVNYTYNTWVRLRAEYSNNASDVFKVGANSASGNAGNNAAQSGRNIGGFSAGTFPTNTELLALVYLNHLMSASEISAFDAAVATKYGGTIGL